MINVKPEVLAALEENTDLLALLGGPHIYQLKAPESLNKYITLFELTNFDSAWADGTAFMAEVHLQVDVWVKGDSTSPIAAEVDKTMKTLGFKRTGSADLYEDDTEIYHKALRYVTEREI
jgi:hypothetical protein